MLKKGIIKVSVATIWTKEDSPRVIDQEAITNPANIELWLSKLNFKEKLDFCDQDLIQTQVLYGQEVTILSSNNDWYEIAVPAQPTSKNGIGFLGHVPSCQVHLLKEDECPAIKSDQIAIVKVPKSLLTRQNDEIEVSYGTFFSVIDSSENVVHVQDASTTGTILRKDVNITNSKDFWYNYNIETVMKEAELFLGLPYLWGGVSSFGFDCSGLVHLLFRSNGLILPRKAREQALIGKKILWEDRQRGDLLFFAKERGTRRIHHVALYYGDDKMLHSPATGKKIEIIPVSSYENFLNLCLIKRLEK